MQASQRPLSPTVVERALAAFGAVVASLTILGSVLLLAHSVSATRPAGAGPDRLAAACDAVAVPGRPAVCPRRLGAPAPPQRPSGG